MWGSNVDGDGGKDRSRDGGGGARVGYEEWEMRGRI